jgi:uncharacterized protein
MIDSIKPALLEKILEDYTLPRFGIHGIRHWARVYENGMKLGKQNEANLTVVGLFAVFHDSRRVNEAIDPGHGKRAAEFMRTLWGSYFEISDEECGLLYAACANHTDERNHSNVTIQTCYDADRLDLARAGIRVDPQRLCTPAAKRPDVIKWANERSVDDHCPDFVHDIWLDFDK